MQHKSLASSPAPKGGASARQVLVSFPNVQRCFHGAATGDGCRYEYSERCKNYVPPQKG